MFQDWLTFLFQYLGPEVCFFPKAEWHIGTHNFIDAFECVNLLAKLASVIQ